MTIPQTLVERLDQQARRNSFVVRGDEEKEAAVALRELSIEPTDAIGEFYLRYCMDAIEPADSVGITLLDVCNPSREVLQSTEFVRRAYGVGQDYLCLDAAEAEGFVLYSISAQVVYDTGLDQLTELNAGQLRPRWKSFFDLMDWYVK